MQKLTQYTVIKNARRAHPVLFDRVAAGLAVVAWLALAGDAFAQETNQWAPTPEGQPAATLPAENAHVWSNGAATGANVFAPADLDQRLTGEVVAPAPMPAPIARPVVTAPIYAPAALANPAVQPQPVAPQYAAPQGYPAAQGYGNGYGNGFAPMGPQFGAPGMGYGGYGAPMQPYGAGYGAMPGGYPIGNGFGPGYGNGFGPGYGGYGPGYGGYGNNIPSSNIWGGNNSNYSNGGIPFFGGSPLGFW